MSIIVNKNSKVLVQGFTGSEGTFHSEQMIEYGTNVVAGVNRGKGGQEALGVPVFNSVQEAVEKQNARHIFRRENQKRKKIVQEGFVFLDRHKTFPGFQDIHRPGIARSWIALDSWTATKF